MSSMVNSSLSCATFSALYGYCNQDLTQPAKYNFAKKIEKISMIASGIIAMSQFTILAKEHAYPYLFSVVGNSTILYLGVASLAVTVLLATSVFMTRALTRLVDDSRQRELEEHSSQPRVTIGINQTINPIEYGRPNSHRISIPILVANTINTLALSLVTRNPIYLISFGMSIYAIKKKLDERWIYQRIQLSQLHSTPDVIGEIFLHIVYRLQKEFPQNEMERYPISIPLQTREGYRHLEMKEEFLNVDEELIRITVGGGSVEVVDVSRNLLSSGTTLKVKLLLNEYPIIKRSQREREAGITIFPPTTERSSSEKMSYLVKEICGVPSA